MQKKVVGIVAHWKANAWLKEDCPQAAILSMFLDSLILNKTN